jgi:hypothetical protein
MQLMAVAGWWSLYSSGLDCIKNTASMVLLLCVHSVETSSMYHCIAMTAYSLDVTICICLLFIICHTKQVHCRHGRVRMAGKASRYAE